MFYCDVCAQKQSWPQSFSKSRGTCEMCGEHAVCNDRPSSLLPPRATDFGRLSPFPLDPGESVQIDVQQQSGLLHAEHTYDGEEA